MKKLFLLTLVIILMVGCRKNDIYPTPQPIAEELKISNSVGIKLQSHFVTSEVAMNVKTETSGQITIKIFDIGNRVVSKETTNVTAGDNVLKVYTNALPSSGYRIGLFDANGKLLGITDFNKL